MEEDKTTIPLPIVSAGDHISPYLPNHSRFVSDVRKLSAYQNSEDTGTYVPFAIDIWVINFRPKLHFLKSNLISLIIFHNEQRHIVYYRWLEWIVFRKCNVKVENSSLIRRTVLCCC